MFRNILSSSLRRFFKTESVFIFSAIYPIYNPKVYKKSSLNENESTMFLRGCELLTSGNCAYSPVTQAIDLPMKDQLRFRKNLFSSRKLFVVQLCVEKCFEAIGTGCSNERSTYCNPSAAADVKEIDFHKLTRTITNIWNGEFGEESTCL